MRVMLWCLPAGIFSATALPQLPPPEWLLLPVLVALAILLCAARLKPIAWLLLGLSYGIGWGHVQLATTLPIAADKSDWVVTGHISSLPQTDARRSRFEFTVEHWQPQSPDTPSVEFRPRRLLLSWYGSHQIAAGERWQLPVRLRSLRGYYNPGTFDYHSWLFARRYSATGYVLDRFDPRLLATPDKVPAHWHPLMLRQKLVNRLVALELPTDVTGVMTALIAGDKQGISNEEWRLFRATGTVHLLVVSGLHIGMMAFVGYGLGAGLGRLLAAAGLPLAAPQIAACGALVAALFYGLISGMGLPVQRALAMTAVVLLATLLRRRASPALILGWALTTVALIDPLAVIQSGFWLSFGAVAGLLLWFAPRPFRHYWRSTLESQWVVAVALAAALVAFHGQVALAAPAINLLMIPWMTFAIVPLCLAGAVLMPWPVLADALWQLAGWQIEGLLWLLRWMDGITGSLYWQPAMPLTPVTIAALMIVALSLLLPAGLWLRWPALVLAMALSTAVPVRQSLQVSVLDVGQGLATVVQVDDRVLVYDAGPAWSDSFNAGSGIVAPFLAARGIRQIDKLVVSHDDLDHSGGSQALLESLRVEKLLTSSQPLVDIVGADHCHAGERWRWGTVTFEFLWPEDDGVAKNDNNSSCVLLVQQGDNVILLPGDVEKQAEAALVGRLKARGIKQVTLMLAPHHGSKTSSGEALVATTRPRHVVFTAGFNHHFGHPHPEVVARYRRYGSTLWNTADSGALVFSWDDGRLAAITRHVDSLWGYWRHPGPRAKGEL